MEDKAKKSSFVFWKEKRLEKLFDWWEARLKEIGKEWCLCFVDIAREFNWDNWGKLIENLKKKWSSLDKMM